MPDAKIGVKKTGNGNIKGDEGATEEIKIRKKNAKENILLSVTTEPFADDTELYVPRLNRQLRTEYWSNIIAQGKFKRVAPEGFKQWVYKDRNLNKEIDNYPSRYVLLLNIVRSPYWDQLYLNMMILFLLLTVYFYDGYAERYGSSSSLGLALILPETVIIVPLVFMFIFQLVPFLGILYFVAYCNDLTHLRAAQNFGDWAFVSVLTAQCVEKFFYGGIGQSHRAGRCRLGQPKPGAGAGVVAGAEHKDQDRDIEAMAGVGAKLGLESVLEAEENKSLEDNSTIVTKVTFDEGEHDHVAKGGDNLAGGGNNITADDNSSVTSMHSKRSVKSSQENSVLSAGRRKKMASNAKACLQEMDEASDVVNEDHVLEWLEWTCVTCGLQNRQPKCIVRRPQVFFGSAGEYYKRTYAIIKPRRHVPQCKKCFTDADYTPPLASAHLFIHNSKPHAAFEAYPAPCAVQAGLGNDPYLRAYHDVRSVLFGLRDDHDSLLVNNDWRLRKWLASKYPTMPRQVKPPEELYRLGEVVECRLQKSDWARARIIEVRAAGHTYDIRYDPGDELRFVDDAALRLPPQKGFYAYRVELGMVVLVLTFPLFLLIAVSSTGTTGQGLVLLPLFLVSLSLLLERVYCLIKSFLDYYQAGFMSAFRLFLLYSLPLILLVAASGSALSIDKTSKSSSSGWSCVCIVFNLAQLSSLHLLYMMRPTYCLMLTVLLPLAFAGEYLAAGFVSSTGLGLDLGYCLLPLLLTVLMLKYIRRHIHAVWDVCLVVRPPMLFDAPSAPVWERIVGAMGL